MHDSATELMPLTPARATPVMSRKTVGGMTPKRRIMMLSGMGVVSVAIVAIIASSGNGRAAIPPAPVHEQTLAERENSLAANAAATAKNLEETDSVIVRVGLSPMSKEMRLGDSIQLVATVYGAGGDALPNKVRWSSGDSSVAIVSGNGWVHAIRKTGTTPVFIYAEAGKRTGTATISVK